MKLENKQWYYVKRPEAQIGAENYELRKDVIDTSELKENEILIRSKYVSVDPYMRIHQSIHNTWEKPQELNTLQGSGVVGEVIESRSDKFIPGDFVNAYTGWQEYAVINADQARKLYPKIPVSTALSILGMPARVAYFGLLEEGELKSTDTVVVSGAAGAVGSIVVQLAKLKGCRVVGTAGTQEKIDYLQNELGIDVALNYKEHDSLEKMTKALAEACPEGIDVYYDNVGGNVTDAVFNLINHKARILICGQISQYNHGLDTPEMGPRFLHKMLYTRAKIQGILSRDYNHRMDEMLAEMEPLVQSGKLKYKETIMDGFENLPAALSGLFDGSNKGKMLVKIY
ncbi:NADP-dependent oxidoreductase [Pontixanthobacter gangjinensis]|uniref:NADP-dependent oxidoreductase n=1 Tax=Christiangramia aestuarii TaxID=1028746 RepID=A0A7K1LPT3_9FLAO|nr:NADP-dependent oxidoreductase [Christiangramia aestuarii]MUP42794.1 NADP-dependent oxidoreductase [Christiangramia aestuarii]